MRTLGCLICVLAMLFPLPSLAGRTFPGGAVYGELKAQEYPYARIGDKVYSMGPGLRIYDTTNRMILTGALPQEAKVLYRLGPQGELLQLWLLTDDEAASLSQAGQNP
jgi:hypothetical protein